MAQYLKVLLFGDFACFGIDHQRAIVISVGRLQLDAISDTVPFEWISNIHHGAPFLCHFGTVIDRHFDHHFVTDTDLEAMSLR